WPVTDTHPSPTLFPYTTLFRSCEGRVIAAPAEGRRTYEKGLAQSPVHGACRASGIRPAVDGGSAVQREAGWRTYEKWFAHSPVQDRKSTRLNSSHLVISYAVFC